MFPTKENKSYDAVWLKVSQSPQIGSMFPTILFFVILLVKRKSRNPLESGQCFLLYKLQVSKLQVYKLASCKVAISLNRVS